MESTRAETKAQELRIKYRRRMYNKRAGKPRVTQILMERTFNAALLVLGVLDGIKWNDLLFYQKPRECPLREGWYESGQISWDYQEKYLYFVLRMHPVQTA